VPFSENSSPPWCLKLVTGLYFCLRPSIAVPPKIIARAGPPSPRPEPVTQTLSCELNLIETYQLCLFLKHSHTVALICMGVGRNVSRGGGQRRRFVYHFSGCERCNTNGPSQNASPFLHHKENSQGKHPLRSHFLKSYSGGVVFEFVKSNVLASITAFAELGYHPISLL